MSDCRPFNEIVQDRTTIGVANTWVALTIPVGARNPLIGVEESTASFRISYNNTINASTQGTFISAGGFYAFNGLTSVQLTIYISASETTSAILQYTKE